MTRFFLTVVFLFAPFLGTASEWIENFDNSAYSPISSILTEHKYIELVQKVGKDASNAIKVSYVGYNRGSKRVVVQIPLKPQERYMMGFWVKFCEDFDFVKGGKLHGFGSLNPTTGGDKVTSSSWSARLMFTANGGIKSYVYHQEMRGKYGDSKKVKNFNFKRGIFYHVQMVLKLNQPVTESNGELRLWIDNKLLLVHSGIKFRSVDSFQSKINNLLFSTFHGGSNESWAPKNKDGAFKTDCAYFDDIYISSKKALLLGVN